MQTLPLDQVEGFERRLVETTWHARSWTRRRDGLALSLGLLGLRWEEVSRLLVGDLGADGTVWVRTAKKGTPRRLPAGQPLVNAIRDMVVNAPVSSVYYRRSHSRVFFTKSGLPLAYTALSRTCRLWTRKYFGRPFTLHCLRHTAAARIYYATRDVLAVQRFLGHVSLRSTSYYLAKLIPVEVAGLPTFSGVGLRVGLRLFDPDSIQERRVS